MLGLGTGGSLGKWSRRISASDTDPALIVDQRGTGDIAQFQDSGVAVFTIADGGAITTTGSLTIANLILAEAIVPAGTNAYVARDNTGDLTLNALSTKQVNIAIAGTDEVTISATIVDVNSNEINNIGVSGFNLTSAGIVDVAGVSGNIWSAANLTHVGGGQATFEQINTATNSLRTILTVQASTTDDMVDGYGVIALFKIQDSGVSDQNAGFMGFRRAGADDTTDFVLSTYVSNVVNEALRVDSAGVLSIDSNFVNHDDDGGSLGISGTAWSDLYLASGAVIDWAAGDVTLTHSAGVLAFGGDGTVSIDFNNHEMVNVDVDSGAIDGTIIGGASAAAGTFTAIVGTSLILSSGELEVNDAIHFDTGVAVTAARYEITRDADGTNQLHLNVPTGATFELSVNDVVEMTLSATAVDFQGNSITTTGGGSLTGTWTDLGSVTTVDVNGGTIDGTTIGGAVVAAGSFSAIVGTTITGSGILSIDDTTESTSATTGSIHTDGGIGVALDLFVAGVIKHGAAGSLTIASGVVVITKSYHTLVVEGGAGSGADTLVTATGGAEGDELILKITTSGANDQVTVQNGTGGDTFIMLGGADFIMDHLDDRIRFLHNGTEWVEETRSSNS